MKRRADKGVGILASIATLQRWVPLALILVGLLILGGCPARRPAGSPLDLESTLLDRA